MTITQMIAREVEVMAARGKTPDEILERVRVMMREHNRQTYAELFFKEILDDAVSL